MKKAKSVSALIGNIGNNDQPVKDLEIYSHNPEQAQCGVSGGDGRNTENDISIIVETLPRSSEQMVTSR